VVDTDRAAILRRFEAWLDEALASETPPTGIAGELLAELADGGGAEENERPSMDLYSMQAAITALTQEVKLQSRAYKQLSDALAPLSDLQPQVDALVSEHAGAIDELRREAERRAQADILDALLDMRDRLTRGLAASRQCLRETPRTPKESWLSKLLGYRADDGARQAAQALEQGYRLTLDRLNEMLQRFHVSEIPCEGREFDAESMSAVDTQETTSAPEGFVLEVYRAGYEWNGEIYRTAQVKVARAPGASEAVEHRGPQH